MKLIYQNGYRPLALNIKRQLCLTDSKTMSAQRAKALVLRLEVKICHLQHVSSIFNSSRL